MPKPLLVGTLVLSCFLDGCATSGRMTQTPETPVVSSGWEVLPQEPSHPFLSWCRKHPVTTVAGCALLAGAVVVVAEGALALSLASNIH
jgi:hypothetical protein